LGDPELALDFDADQRTALHISCLHGFHNITLLLADFGASMLSRRGEDGQTPIDLAFRYCHKYGVQDETGWARRGIEILDRLEERTHNLSRLRATNVEFYKTALFRKYFIDLKRVEDVSEYLFLVQGKDSAIDN